MSKDFGIHNSEIETTLQQIGPVFGKVYFDESFFSGPFHI
ncbi:unnamed protein product [Bacillus velezensis]|nr:unnamed protein product [Bacillus velezensis]